MFLATVVGLFWYVSRQEFYRSYTQQEKDGDGGPTSPEINLLHVLREGRAKKMRKSFNYGPVANFSTIFFKPSLSQTWTFHLAAFLNFFVTLGVFPTYFSLAETTSDSKVGAKYF